MGRGKIHIPCPANKERLPEVDRTVHRIRESGGKREPAPLPSALESVEGLWAKQGIEDHPRYTHGLLPTKTFLKKMF